MLFLEDVVTWFYESLRLIDLGSHRCPLTFTTTTDSSASTLRIVTQKLATSYSTHATSKNICGSTSSLIRLERQKPQGSRSITYTNMHSLFSPQPAPSHDESSFSLCKNCCFVLMYSHHNYPVSPGHHYLSTWSRIQTAILETVEFLCVLESSWSQNDVPPFNRIFKSGKKE